MSFLEQPITILKMGARQHEALLYSISDQVKGLLEKQNWTCHRCGVRIEGFMQVDHTQGHNSNKGLKAICVFCHDQDHILWAGARKRVIPIIGFDLTNEQISRIAWAMLALSNSKDSPEVKESLHNIKSAFKKRHNDFVEKWGSADADSMNEAIYRFLVKVDGENDVVLKQKKNIVKEYVRDVRFVPSFILNEDENDVSETISVWGIGGYAAPKRTPVEAIGLSVEPINLISAVSNMNEEKS